MSFRCEECAHTFPNGTSPHHVVQSVRPVTYNVTLIATNKRNWRRNSTGVGYETVEETLICESCASEVGDPDVVDDPKTVSYQSLGRYEDGEFHEDYIEQKAVEKGSSV